MHDLTVIIPNLNGKNFMKQCLDSINIQKCLVEVIVVDNASTDGSQDYIKTNYPNVELIENTENLGFAAAVNQGINASTADFVFLMNNDVVLELDCIKNLLNCIASDEKIFAVSSKMLQYNDKTVIDDAGDEYTILGWTKKIGNGESADKFNNEREIFSACAGASLYRRKIFDIIGCFDENFFAYMEDVDISYRARIYGYKCIYCPQAIVYHVGSATSGSKYNSFKISLAARNNVYVPYKNMPTPQLAVNIIFLLIGFSIKYIFFQRKGHGKDYIKGLKEGFNSLSRVEKIKYSNVRLFKYLSIEWLLIKNIFRSLI
jgi:GT2 family glycosyltransferase